MIKRLLVAAVLAFALVLGGCHGQGFWGNLSFVDHDAKFKSLQDQINALDNQIASLQEQLDNLGQTGGDNVVVIDQDTINEIFNQINILNEQVADLTAQLAALEAEVGDQAQTNAEQDARLTALESKCDEVLAAVASLGERVTALEEALEGLGNGEIPPRPEGGPAYVFSGSGVPSNDIEARNGDFYIDLEESQTGSHRVYLYMNGEWVYFGQIFKANGPPPSAPARLVRF